MARTGRRPGKQDTREAILRAARDSFAERGYDAASIRAIATSAGVDPALVHHYFGTKEELFLATIGSPFDPAQLIPTVLAGGDRGAARSGWCARSSTIWDNPVTGAAGVALLRSALQHDLSARMLREFLTSQILRRVLQPDRRRPGRGADARRAGRLADGGPGAGPLRAQAGAAGRAPTAETVAALLAPNIRRYLLEPLPLALRTGDAGAITE